jgi:hypothetical protein
MRRIAATALLLTLCVGCGGKGIEVPSSTIPVPKDPPSQATKGLPIPPAGGPMPPGGGAKPPADW